MVLGWWRGRVNRTTKSPSRNRRRDYQPRVEVLEARCLLAASIQGVPFTANEGQSFTGTVATFTDPGGPTAASGYTATLQFGDNHFGNATVTGSNGNFSVVMTHTYHDEGILTPVVYINEKKTGVEVGQTTTTATILERDSFTATALTFTPTQNVAFTGTVANFADTNLANNSSSDFGATIDWGDGGTSTGAITFNGLGKFSVSGSHTFAQAGSFTVNVTFADDDSGTATATAASTANVAAGNPLVPHGLSFTAADFQAFTGTVATFSDSNAGDAASQFTATVSWGDGGNTAVSISGGNGSFTVSGTHTYAQDGAFAPTVTLKYKNGTFKATAKDIADVTASNASGAGTALAATEGTAIAGAVATFTDPGSPTASGLSALIAWGDRMHALGSISGSNGSYTVSGAHTFVDEGSDTITVTLSKPGAGTIATATSSATVAEGDSLSGSGTAITATEGQAFTGTVATFADSNPASSALGFTATIDWGDGNTTAGTVIEQGGAFVVLGSYTYADEGSYTANVTLTDPGSGTASATAQTGVTVAEGDALTGNPYIIMAPPNKTFGVTVATFTDTNTANAASDFTATIDWGDGSTSAGIVTGGTGGNYTVRGSHDYASSGTFTVNVTLADDAPGTAAATAPSTANIAVGNTVSSQPSGSGPSGSPSSGSGGSSPASPPGGTTGTSGSGATRYGDFNHDGYTDMAVGIPGFTVNGLVGAGAVEVFYGGPNGLSATPNLILTENSANVPKKSAAGDAFGFSLAVGDFKGSLYTYKAVPDPLLAFG
jgi:hypothetical protein